MRIDIMTLFPEMCDSVLGESIIGRARKSGYVEINCHNIRDFSVDKHHHVDDYTYGGGAGMIMQATPIFDCYQSICDEIGKKPYCIYMSPAGKTFNEQIAKDYSKLDNLVILCGHYEGVDERVIEEIVDEEISIGDFVLTGGELPALMVSDAVSRLLPGVLAGEECYIEESHYSGLLEYPQYTRPPVWHEKEVPPVLLTGHSANIEKWRKTEQLKRTLERREDMLETAKLSPDEMKILGKITKG